MVLEWREREHEEFYVTMERDVGSQLSLKRCGIYKFWVFKGMRAQVRLLQILVKLWDPDTEALKYVGKTLRIEFEDIYFIIGLS
jgi:hypothetical protein